MTIGTGEDKDALVSEAKLVANHAYAVLGELRKMLSLALRKLLCRHARARG